VVKPSLAVSESNIRPSAGLNVPNHRMRTRMLLHTAFCLPVVLWSVVHGLVVGSQWFGIRKDALLFAIFRLRESAVKFLKG